MTGWDRIAAWSRRNLPTRESMERIRLLRPVAHRVLAPELWRFTRRSVPRGVALGMIAGILFPFAQIAIAALIARGSSSCARRLIAATSASSFCSRRPKSLTPASAFLPASARESCSSRCSAW